MPPRFVSFSASFWVQEGRRRPHRRITARFFRRRLAGMQDRQGEREVMPQSQDEARRCLQIHSRTAPRRRGAAFFFGAPTEKCSG